MMYSKSVEVRLEGRLTLNKKISNIGRGLWSCCDVTDNLKRLIHRFFLTASSLLLSFRRTKYFESDLVLVEALVAAVQSHDLQLALFRNIIPYSCLIDVAVKLLDMSRSIHYRWHPEKGCGIGWMLQLSLVKALWLEYQR
jgi:hypothetical protein